MDGIGYHCGPFAYLASIDRIILWVEISISAERAACHIALGRSCAICFKLLVWNFKHVIKIVCVDRTTRELGCLLCTLDSQIFSSRQRNCFFLKMHTHPNAPHPVQPQQAVPPPGLVPPAFTVPPRPIGATGHTMVTLSDLERLVAPIPAFLYAVAEWPDQPGTVSNLRVVQQEDGEFFRLSYQLEVGLLGGADTPLDASVAALLRINRQGYSVPHSYPLNVTVEMHLNPRSRRPQRTRCLLVFSVSRRASVAACRFHVHLMLQYLVDRRNIRPLDASERKMMGRTPNQPTPLVR